MAGVTGEDPDGVIGFALRMKREWPPLSSSGGAANLPAAASV